MQDRNRELSEGQLQEVVGGVELSRDLSDGSRDEVLVDGASDAGPGDAAGDAARDRRLHDEH